MAATKEVLKVIIKLSHHHLDGKKDSKKETCIASKKISHLRKTKNKKRKKKLGPA